MCGLHLADISLSGWMFSDSGASCKQACADKGMEAATTRVSDKVFAFLVLELLGVPCNSYNSQAVPYAPSVVESTNECFPYGFDAYSKTAAATGHIRLW